MVNRIRDFVKDLMNYYSSRAMDIAGRYDLNILIVKEIFLKKCQGRNNKEVAEGSDFSRVTVQRYCKKFREMRESEVSVLMIASSLSVYRFAFLEDFRTVKKDFKEELGQEIEEDEKIFGETWKKS